MTDRRTDACPDDWRFTAVRATLAALAALLASATFLATSAQAASWELRVCAEYNSMPFSRTTEDGFENRIAEILADELGAELTYVWSAFGPQMFRDQLREGNCDLVMGVPDGYAGLISTLSYYRSPFVFIFRSDSPYDIRSFDDPILASLRLGVESAAGPEHEALLERGLGPNVELMFTGRGTDNNPDPLARVVVAVADGTIDVAVAWGASAGYYAARQEVPLTVNPTPEFIPPFTPLYINMTIGVRRGDESLRDRLSIALARRWDDVQAVLDDYDVPRLPIARPSVPEGVR